MPLHSVIRESDGLIDDRERLLELAHRTAWPGSRNSLTIVRSIVRVAKGASATAPSDARLGFYSGGSRTYLRPAP